jgi:hypothetical protein
MEIFMVDHPGPVRAGRQAAPSLYFQDQLTLGKHILLMPIAQAIGTVFLTWPPNRGFTNSGGSVKTVSTSYTCANKRPIIGRS